MFLGAATADMPGLIAFEQAAGRRAAVWSTYSSWATAPDFDAGLATATLSRGTLPMITWEPWVPTAGADQPYYGLRRIADGAFDDYLRHWAGEVAAWGGPLLLRFAHEANLASYPWAAAANGNVPQDYIAAWRHVHDVVAAAAPRVIWVWGVNVLAGGNVALRDFYPGDRYVDWVGVDGYNGGAALPFGGWLSADRIFAGTFHDVAKITGRPIIISEVGSAEIGGNKADWITDFFVTAQRLGARGVIWFDMDKETDWRVASTPASAAAFHTAVSRLPARPTLLPSVTPVAGTERGTASGSPG